MAFCKLTDIHGKTTAVNLDNVRCIIEWNADTTNVVFSEDHIISISGSFQTVAAAIEQATA